MSWRPGSYPFTSRIFPTLILPSFIGFVGHPLPPLLFDELICSVVSFFHVLEDRSEPPPFRLEVRAAFLNPAGIMCLYSFLISQASSVLFFIGRFFSGLWRLGFVDSPAPEPNLGF